MQINQAFQTLDNVIASLQLPRQDHAVLQQALQLLISEAKDGKEWKRQWHELADAVTEEKRQELIKGKKNGGAK